MFIHDSGGGSGTGLSQIQTGAVDIGNSDLFAEEKPGIKAHALVDHKVAVVGIAPIVKLKVGVKNVYMTQLTQIFLGLNSHWKQLGGQNVPIVLVHRATGTGTRATFEKWALEGQTPIAALEQDSTGMVRTIVGSTPGDISYVAFSYVDKTVRSLSVDGVAHTDSNVDTNRWHIWSYEHMYNKGRHSGLTQRFLTYMMTPAILKKLDSKMGDFPMK